MTCELGLKAVKNAIKVQSVKEGLIIHSDMGSQYTSGIYTEYLKAFGIKASYSAKGCPYDKACIESFHATIKKEKIYAMSYTTYNEMKLILFHYIEGWYNRKRIHSSINYMTQQEYEEAIKKSG